MASAASELARNVLVHGYDDVDLKIVEDVLTHHLDDLLALVDVVRRGATA